MKRNSRHSEWLIYCGLATILWLYLWMKAYRMPLTHDEIATFFYFVQPGSFLPFLSKWEANNHILNSALSAFFYQIFGSSYLSLRLSNLLFFPVYCYYIYKFSKSIRSISLRWLFIIALLCAHHFTEFFALSRGYGMSMAFMVGAAWHTGQALSGSKTSDLILGLVYIFLAVTANMSLMNSYILVSGLLLVHLFISFRNSERNEKVLITSCFILFSLLPLMFYTVYSFEMQERGLLYYGTTKGFWQVTVDSLSYMITGTHALTFKLYAAILFVITCVGSLICIFRQKKFELPHLTDHVFFLLLVGNIAGAVLLELIFGINYPEDRVGMYLYPLFAGSTVIFLDKQTSEKKWPFRLTASLLLLPFLLLPVQFILEINTKYAFNYKNDYMPERFYHTVKQSHKQGELPPTIGGYRLRHFTWSMLDFRFGGTESQIYSTSFPGLETDFQIADLSDSPLFPAYYDTIDRDEINGRYLMKRKHFLEKTLMINVGDISTNGAFSKEFFNIYSCPMNSLIDKTIYVATDLTIFSKHHPFCAWIVFNIKDKNRKDLRYEFIALDWLRPSWNGEKSNFLNGMILHEIPEGSETLKIYLWNMNSRPFSIDSGRCMIYEMERDY